LSHPFLLGSAMVSTTPVCPPGIFLNHTLPSAMASTASAETFVPAAGLLHKLALGLAERNGTVAHAWATTSSISADTDLHELGGLLCSAVPLRDLARFAHRLQRRSAGLGDDWTRFCNANGQQNPDPHASEPWQLLQFICWAIACAPDRVAMLKGPFDPFMEAAVQIAKDELERSTEASSPLDLSPKAEQVAPDFPRTAAPEPSKAPLAARAASSGRGRWAEAARPLDVKDDSTMSGSIASKSDRSDAGSSDKEAMETLSAAAWLGPEPA